MKCRIIIVSIFFSFLAHCQSDYFEDGTRWRISRSYAPGPSCLWTYEYNYNIFGDSLVNGLNYKKLNTYSKYWNYFNNPNCGPSGEAYGTTLMRQDSLKVYVIIGGNEELLYDFDIEINDTLYDPPHWSSSIKYIVKNIDTVMIDNEPRRRFWVGDSMQMPFFTYLIEGVGHNGGLLVPYDFVWGIGHSSSLNCFQYRNIDYPIANSNCNFDLSSNELINKPTDFIIIPNPTYDVCRIEGIYNINKLEVHDVSGANMNIQYNHGEKQINISKLRSGTYFIYIETDLGVVWKKVIKL